MPLKSIHVHSKAEEAVRTSSTRTVSPMNRAYVFSSGFFPSLLVRSENPKLMLKTIPKRAKQESVYNYERMKKCRFYIEKAEMKLKNKSEVSYCMHLKLTFLQFVLIFTINY